MMNGLRQSSIFRSYFVSYLLILIIPVITGYISYHISARSVINTSVQSSSAIFYHAMEVLESDFKKVTQFTTQLSLDHSINMLLTAPRQEEGIYDAASLRQAVQAINTYSLTGGMLQNFYIFIKSYDAILTPDGAWHGAYWALLV